MRKIIIVLSALIVVVHYTYLLVSLDSRMALSTQNAEIKESLRALEQKLEPIEKQARDAKALSQKLHHLTTDLSVAQISRDDLVVAESGTPPLTLSGLKEIEAQAIESELLNEKAEFLSHEIGKHILSLSRLVDHFEDQRELRTILPSIKPVEGSLSSPFGPRMDPYSGQGAMHTGTDFAAPEGTVVIAPAFGRVIFYANDGQLGNLLILDHGAGYQTQYGHLKQALVEVGAVVERGQAIAQVGNTGKSTGPHLHYEIRKLGIPVNPMQFIID
jgi:murein DD-endopeptidase MepM/ murein hydrolase activator NlpD